MLARICVVFCRMDKQRMADEVPDASHANYEQLFGIPKQCGVYAFQVKGGQNNQCVGMCEGNQMLTFGVDFRF